MVLLLLREVEVAGEQRAAVTGCPGCGRGRLVKHCEPNDRCGWWECDRGCGNPSSLAGHGGYRIDLTSGVESWPERVRGVSSGSDDAQRAAEAP